MFLSLLRLVLLAALARDLSASDGQTTWVVEGLAASHTQGDILQEQRVNVTERDVNMYICC